MVVKFYGWERVFYPNIQMQVVTQYFQSEHLIPLNNFKDFYVQTRKYIQDDITHLSDIILSLENIGFEDYTMRFPDINEIILQFMNERQFCIKSREDNKIVYAFRKPFDPMNPDSFSSRMCTGHILNFEDMDPNIVLGESECLGDDFITVEDTEDAIGRPHFNLQIDVPTKITTTAAMEVGKSQ